MIVQINFKEFESKIKLRDGENLSFVHFLTVIYFYVYYCKIFKRIIM